MGRGKRRSLTPLSAEPAPSRVPDGLSASLTAPLPDDRLERLSDALGLGLKAPAPETPPKRFLGLVAAVDYKGDPFCYPWIEADSWEDFCTQLEAQAKDADDPNPLPNYVVEISADPDAELEVEALDYSPTHGLSRGEPLAAAEATPKALLDHLEDYGY